MSSLLNVERFANRNPAFEQKGWNWGDVIGEGKYKIVEKGIYDHSGDPAADKFLKIGVTFSDECFLNDVRVAEAALPYVAVHQYTESTPYRGRISIKVNIPAVWRQLDGPLAGQRMLREPFIERFQKFNSNSGAADATAAVAQALSHYSYHASDGQELLCDLQGGKIGDSYVLSDVVLMSLDQKYGNTDLGAMGIENWLNHHRCNHFCNSSWKNWSGAQALLAPVFSTTTTLEATANNPAIGQECIRARPSSIMFTQDSIKDQFRDGHSLLETALQIAREDVGKRDIPMITVVRVHDGRLFALDNRRLAVFRLLEICGRVGTIKVVIEDWTRWSEEWDRKTTTSNGGAWITLRPGRHHRIGRDKQETRIPCGWLQKIQDARRCRAMTDNQFAVFVRTFDDD